MPVAVSWNSDLVGIGLGSPDLPGGRRLFDVHAVDGVAPYVIVAAQERAGTEKAPESAVVERGNRFAEGCSQRQSRA